MSSSPTRCMRRMNTCIWCNDVPGLTFSPEVSAMLESKGLEVRKPTKVVHKSYPIPAGVAVARLQQ